MKRLHQPVHAMATRGVGSMGSSVESIGVGVDASDFDGHLGVRVDVER